MRHWIFALSLLTASLPTAMAQVSLGIALPGISIGVNVPIYPELVQVPEYPVYYAPRLSSNFFFYDGLYWVFQHDQWYASSWYNGPWWYVPPEAIPVFVLQVPVRYYRNPPQHFRNWHQDTAPHWGEQWGSGWEQQRRNWDRQHLQSQRAPAPLPLYQQRFPAQRYPSQQEQQRLQDKNYRHRPADPDVRRQFEVQREHRQNNPQGHGEGRGEGRGEGHGKGH